MTWPDAVTYIFGGMFFTAILLALYTDFWDNISQNLFSRRR